MKKENLQQTKIDHYLESKKGMFLNRTNTATIGKTIMAASLPIVFLSNPLALSAQGGCGAANNVTAGAPASTVSVDIDGGGADFVFAVYAAQQVFLQINNGFSVAFNGTRNGTYPIAHQLAINDVIPGAFAFSPGKLAATGNRFHTLLDNAPAGNTMPWQEGESGYIAIKKGSSYGFIHLTFPNATNRMMSIDVNASGFAGTGNTGDITIGNCSSLLPVELTSFKAISNKQSIQLAWGTASEINNAGFEVERSIDNKNFKNLAFVEGKGTTFEEQEYLFDDKDLRKGQLYYYRLKQIDYDGQFEYSDVLTARLESGTISATFSPNPSQNGQTRLDYIAVESGKINLSIFDATGKELMQQKYSAQKGDNQFDLDLSALGTGMFFVKIKQGELSTYEKLVNE